MPHPRQEPVEIVVAQRQVRLFRGYVELLERLADPPPLGVLDDVLQHVETRDHVVCPFWTM
ncbi:hypothetical protein GCM10027360_53310 [Amycolatopsis echigonensis]